ncbi:hypothetical protein BX600DRAFT_383844 [Xylariales sp. PMI_506]|nr:hypothetical protein BX600DRAFT_383844 [Xylariales sp. PMI_506]
MRVLISGAGVAGPTLAWFLARTGAQVTVVEKSQSLLPHGQNVDIKGAALTIIKKMGLMEKFRKLNTTEKGTRFIDPNGRPFAPLPVNEGRMNSFTSEFEILRADLAVLLYEATEDHPNVTYRFGTTISNVISNDDDAVRVELSNGEVHDFDLLAAADGQWSKVRKQCFPAEDVNVVRMGSYTAYYTIPRLPTDDDWWNVYFGLGSRLISLRPDPHGGIRALFSRMPRGDAQDKPWRDASQGGGGDRTAQIELLRREFADAGWQATRILKAADTAPDFYFHELQQIKMKRWSRSRVVCLGDAAYAPSPLTGNGTTLAIAGAYVLAGELSRLGEGEHPARALDAYASVFRSYAEEMQEVPFVFPGIMHPEGRFARWVYQTLAWALSKASSVQWLANEFSDAESLEENFPWPDYDILDGKSLE